MPRTHPDDNQIPSVPLPVPLPAEIYELIIDVLFDSRQTLRSCALVCHLFAQRAQKHLFARVDFTRPVRTAKRILGRYIWPTERFLQLLTVSPHIAPHVKHLHISDELHLEPYNEERSWIRRDTSLTSVLPYLEEVETLSIAGYDGRRTWLKFGEWSLGLRCEILCICQCSKLTRLSFSSVQDLPMSLLDRAPNLMELVLTNVLVVPDHYTAEQFQVYHQQQQEEGVQEEDGTLYRDGELALCGRRRAQLKALDITATNWAQWHAFHLFSRYFHLDFSHIRTLDLHITYTSPIANVLSAVGSELGGPGRQAITDLVHGCKAMLETLRLHIPKDGESPLCFFFSSSFLLPVVAGV